MGKRMKSAPVYFTIVQARFNPILTLDTLMPAIQDKLRLMGFPDYQRSVVGTLNLLPQVALSPLTQYVFGNIDRTSSFILDQGSLSLQTTDYDVFDSFSKLFLEGLAIVHDAVQLGYTERVGVRYLDAVFPTSEKGVDDYLATSVQGLLNGITGKVVSTFSESRVQDGRISVVARTIVQDGKVGFPPDLQSVGLLVADRFTSYEGRLAILDTDGFYEHRDSFDLSRLEGLLSEVHSAVTKAFVASVTPLALEAWA